MADFQLHVVCHFGANMFITTLRAQLVPYVNFIIGV